MGTAAPLRSPVDIMIFWRILHRVICSYQLTSLYKVSIRYIINNEFYAEIDDYNLYRGCVLIGDR